MQPAHHFSVVFKNRTWKPQFCCFIVNGEQYNENHFNLRAVSKKEKKLLVFHTHTPSRKMKKKRMNYRISAAVFADVRALLKLPNNAPCALWLANKLWIFCKWPFLASGLSGDILPEPVESWSVKWSEAKHNLSRTNDLTLCYQLKFTTNITVGPHRFSKEKTNISVEWSDSTVLPLKVSCRTYLSPMKKRMSTEWLTILLSCISNKRHNGFISFLKWRIPLRFSLNVQKDFSPFYKDERHFDGKDEKAESISQDFKRRTKLRFQVADPHL